MLIRDAITLQLQGRQSLPVSGPYGINTPFHTHFTHDLSPVEHDFVPFAKAVFWRLLSFQVCESETQTGSHLLNQHCVLLVLLGGTERAAVTDSEAGSSAR